MAENTDLICTECPDCSKETMSQWMKVADKRKKIKKKLFQEELSNAQML